MVAASAAFRLRRPVVSAGLLPRCGRWPRLLVGPLLTLATAGVVEGLAGTPLHLPVPHPLMLTAVVYATFVAGWRSGAASVAIMLAYTAYYFSVPGRFLVFEGDGLRRIVVLAAVSPLMVAVVDVLKRRSEAAVAARDALDRSRAELLAAVTHQVRGPLTNVRGAVDCLRVHQRDPDPATGRALEILEAQVAELDRLVGAVLESARVEDGARPLRPRPVPVADALATAVARLDRAGPGVEAVGDLRVSVLADRDALVDVLSTLLDNAGTHGSGPIEVAARRTGRQVLVTVRDHGPGLPPGGEEQVFEKFHRGDGPAAGYGLGLFICRRLVEAQGGRVSAATAPGGGARFTVALPVGVSAP